MQAKKIIIFFSLFLITIFSIFYISARKNNRMDYNFVITRFNERANSITFSNNNNEFTFSKFDSKVNDIEKEDSLVKKAFSKKIYIYRKDKKNDKYFLIFILNNSYIYPIDWL
ncbi:hypothetical protein KHA90_06585 [Flavobacterium psychroterrae]|uniref:Uncharacterized protein n=1 Tax=Flavobacterium psychroterrae TaxID=2133767 RepID=A0ABS5P8U1_9FLAO|nr:hypothetical protein [Flavobacterium psychroterrae]MBS7230684.1 hypothetical protein [Flavobacterium psychroterrae]